MPRPRPRDGRRSTGTPPFTRSPLLPAPQQLRLGASPARASPALVYGSSTHRGRCTHLILPGIATSWLWSSL